MLKKCDKFDIDNIKCEKKLSESKVYLWRKLERIMLNMELEKKMKGKGVNVNCINNGMS